MNKQRLFVGSCMALAVTAMSFAIRGDISPDLESVFELSKTNVGWILGAAFWGFGLSIIIGGPLCDYFGMHNILRLAALGHLGGTILTIIAPSFPMLFLATLIIGIANGFVEAAINPLVASMYTKEKTSKLTMLHAWFPGGIVIGGVLSYALTESGFGLGTEHGWQIKMALMIIPTIMYAALFMGQKFPATERVEAGVPFGDMFKELLRPLFIVIWLVMWLTAATELCVGAWVPNIYQDLTGSSAGILVVVFINGIMYLFRQFGGGLAHRFTPVKLIAFTSVFAFVGLWMYNLADRMQNTALWFVAAAVFALGVAYWWPSMLGITSERFPRGGALALAVIGGTGSISTAVGGPVMGWINDAFGPRSVLPIWSALPLVICIVFTGVFLYDKARGGYKAEEIAAQEAAAE